MNSVKTKSARRYLHWLFSAYASKCRTEELSETLESGAKLIANNIVTFKTTIEEAYSQIKTIVSGKNQQRMNTIREENEDEEYYSDPQIKSLNRSISDIRYLDKRFLDVIQLYKEELKRLAIDLYKWDKKNKQLKSKLRKQEQVVDENIQQPSTKIQDKKSWDLLNKKIQALRKNLKTYEQQIKQKDAEIIRLRSFDTTKDSMKDQQIKTLKRNLTTLRGQKSLMTTQFDNMKKLLSNKEQVQSIQFQQLQKLKLQVQYLSNSLQQNKQKVSYLQNQNKVLRNKNQSVQFQSQQVKSNMNSYIKQCPKQELLHLQQQNKQLSQQLQQCYSKIALITNQLIELQQACQQAVLIQKKKNQQLQLVLAEKNQTIIRLKSSQPQQKYQYYVQLVKLLTKKVMDRDQIIQQLKSN